MGTKANNPRPWTFDDLADVVDGVGLKSVDTLADWLGKEAEQVDAAAFLLGLDVELACPDLVWCDYCATQRTRLLPSGKCPLCDMRDRLAGREAACAEALTLLKPEERELYANTETRRSRRHAEARPSLTVPSEATRRHREALAAYQAEAVERWELRRLTKDYDAAKTRLRRIREKSGTNPRKGTRSEREARRMLPSKRERSE